MIRLLRQALSAVPFQPVTIVMSNGISVTVDHADFAVVLVRDGFIYVELPTEDEPHFLSLRQIVDVRAKNLVLDEPEEA